ncbi:amidohydrolase, partial [Streptomyces sp. NPDC059742]
MTAPAGTTSMPVAGLGPARRPEDPAAGRPAADLLVRNAKVYTGDRARPEARAVAIRDGRIVALGADPGLAGRGGPATRGVDARGRRGVPG